MSCGIAAKEASMALRRASTVERPGVVVWRVIQEGVQDEEGDTNGRFQAHSSVSQLASNLATLMEVGRRKTIERESWKCFSKIIF